MELKTYTAKNEDVLLYSGEPDKSLLDALAEGPGDLWHSSLDQGFTGCFPELVYQTAAYWWFLNDFIGPKQSVNWRLNADAFVVRKAVWDLMGGFEQIYEGHLFRGLDFGFRLIRENAGIPMYVKGLFQPENKSVVISKKDRYTFFSRHFKRRHSYYMLWRKGLLRFPSEFKAYLAARSVKMIEPTVIPPRPLKPLQGSPTVSLVIPTMKRQEFSELLLQDHKNQTYPIKEAVIVDATPPEERDPKYYKQENYEFEVKVKWQTTKGSCRARNEAIDMCTGDYIIFADDDVRILPDFVENHIRIIQTYMADATNGLDISADNMKQDLSDLKNKLEAIESSRWRVGTSAIFSNANSCVRREVVEQLNGNDVNFDGGYGEDSDFGQRILKSGAVLLHNPFSPNLHLKPPSGGYRFWGQQAKMMGKKRKQQPWELDHPVKWYRPVPSPTVTYGILKHYKPDQVREWRKKHMMLFLSRGKNLGRFFRIFLLPYKQLQFSKSLAYARRLIKLGERNS